MVRHKPASFQIQYIYGVRSPEIPFKLANKATMSMLRQYAYERQCPAALTL